MASPSSDNLTTGQTTPQTNWGDYNRTNFIVQQLIGKLQTSTLVEVISCTNAGGLTPVGYVNIRPLVNQLTVDGLPVPHDVIHNVPYQRLQGGTNAVIIDPVQGDIGIALFASRDISKVKQGKKQGNPGSARQFSFSDAMYIGGLLNGVPTQYVQFAPDGVVIGSETKVTAKVGEYTTELAPSEWKATVAGQTLRLDASGLYHNDVNIGYQHAHSGVVSGPGTSGPPVP